MVITESPSETDQLLSSVLTGAGIHPASAFICSAVSCRPPEGKSPTKREIATCKKWLDYQLAMVKPKYVLLLGNTPLQSITGAAGIKKMRGVPFEKGGIIYVPTYHPAIAKHDPEQGAIVAADVRLFKMIIDSKGIPREKKLNYTAVLNEKDVQRMLDACEGEVSFDIETNSLNPWQKYNEKGEYEPARITLIGVGTAKGQFSFPVDLPTSPWSVDAIDSIVQRLAAKLAKCFVIMQNGKFDALWMWVFFGVRIRIDFDTMIAHYMWDENSQHGLKFLAQRFLGAPNWDVDAKTKKGLGNVDRLAMYHAHDLFYTRELKPFLAGKLAMDKDVERVFRKIMTPLVNMSVEWQYDGIYVDMTKFEAAETYLRTEMETAEKELRKYGDINWGSPTQLADLLFNKLGLKPPALTPTGKPSTNESALNQIDHPCVGALIKYRGHKQQLSFFIEGWKPFLHERRNGTFLHPSTKLNGTVTGRPSAENPNLFQVPRDPRIRTLISAEEGWTFVECDLSQIELRIAANLAREPTMLEYFRNGVDIHWATAIREIERGAGLKELVLDTARTWKQDKKLTYSEAIEVLLEMGPDEAAEIRKEWKEYRKKAKAVNFGYLYGMWWKKFKIYARDNYGVDVTDEQAEASRDFYFAEFSKLPDWHENQRKFVREHGYVRSLSGRKRRLPEAMNQVWPRNIEDPKKQLQNIRRKEAERQAINSPVQSFANELNFMSAIQLRKEYGRDKLKIVGTVYDALLMRIKNQYVEEITERVLEVMSSPPMLKEFGIKLVVPILGEAKVGPWGGGIAFEKWRKEHGKEARTKKRGQLPREKVQSRTRNASVRNLQARAKGARPHA
jgi:DNA polymerase-1